MDNTCKSARAHIITRGNVDGIVSSAIFLRFFPSSTVSYVNSPNSAARALEDDKESRQTFLVDISPNRDLKSAMELFKGDLTVIDHHVHLSEERGSSAAGLLLSYLGLNQDLEPAVAMADYLEGRDSEILNRQSSFIGRKRIEHEARVLDFSWRLDIDDDAFRRVAAESLSRGLLPTQDRSILSRYQRVLEEGRWERALDRASKSVKRMGNVAVLNLSERKRSLHGFGSRACSEIASQIGCSYSLLIHGNGQSASLSVRRLSSTGIDVGNFIEDFTRSNGMSGGGHPASAGGRIPSGSVGKFVEELVSTA